MIVAGQPHGAPSWFPCNDRPSNKATYRMSITAPAGYRVVANGSLLSNRRRSSTVDLGLRAARADGDLPRHRAHRPLRAPHRDDGDVPMHAVLPQRLLPSYDDAFGQQRAMIETFSRLFGPYPFPAYTVVVTDDDLEIPLEAQGLSDLRRQLPDLRLGRPCGWSRTSCPTSGSATA